MVTLEYNVKLDDKAPFLATIKELAQNRRRDEAFSWGIFEDNEIPGKYVATFFIVSILEHMRQHDRMTKADLEVENKAH